CGHYKGQSRPCKAGTFDTSGVAPDGECTASCPAHKSMSLPGARTSTECFAAGANFLVASNSIDRVMAFNGVESTWETLVDGEYLDSPMGIGCLSETLCLVTNNLKSSDSVHMMGVMGEDLGAFANLFGPSVILPLPDKGLVAIGESDEGAVLFFDVYQRAELGRPLEPTDAVGLAQMGSTPRFSDIGERDSEILTATSNDEVQRSCIPNESSCKPGLRNRKLLINAGASVNMGGFVLGIGTLRERGSYLVAIRAPITHDRKVYECPLDEINVPLSSCEIFAGSPTATGFIPGTDFATTIDGGIVVNEDASTYASMSASVTIPYAGTWSLAVTQGAGGVHFRDSPRQIYVTAGDTSPSHSKLSLESNAITAGSRLLAEVEPRDEFDNPTSHKADAFKFYTSDDTSSVELMTPPLPGSNVFSTSSSPTKAGTFLLHVLHASTSTEVLGSPVSFRVFPGDPSAAHTEHSMMDAAKLKIDSTSGRELDVFVIPRDEHENAVETGAFRVEVEGLSGDVQAVNLVPPTFLNTVKIPRALETSLFFSFYMEVEGGGYEAVAERIEVKVKPGSNYTMMYVVVGTLGFVLVLMAAGFKRHRDRHSRELSTIRKGQSRLAAEKDDAIERQRELQEEKYTLDKQHEQIKKSHSKLQKEKHGLQESTKELKGLMVAQRHSEKERVSMKKTMEELKPGKKDELRTVLVQSSDVKIQSLLGQGGMGKVHLASYKGQQVAVKQLLNITDEHCRRFRRECFITKELSHPNIVILVGVCWDEMMLGCILEYVDGGSLQARLNADNFFQPGAEGKITWKGELLKWATEAAMGCQYLHHRRYFDEVDDEWKESIVHRDLKPDNMLVTTAGVLKLTDFGEARSASIDMTMTAVGSPIYICPEIIRNDRYDAKADSYSFGICLVAMMRAKDTIQNFFFEQLMTKMRKKNKTGMGLGSLNRHIEMGWRPKLPVEMYPSLISLVWRCWDDDPTVRPDFDGISKVLMGDLVVEVRSNAEPVFGSGIIIKEMHQMEKDLADDAVVSKVEFDRAMREKDGLVAAKAKVLEEMKEKMGGMEKELEELRRRGGGEGGGGKGRGGKEGGGGAGGSVDGNTAKAKKVPVSGRQKSQEAIGVDSEMGNLLAMMGRDPKDPGSKSNKTIEKVAPPVSGRKKSEDAQASLEMGNLLAMMGRDPKDPGSKSSKTIEKIEKVQGGKAAEEAAAKKKLKAEEEAAAKKLKAEEEAVKAEKEAAAKKLKAEKEAAAKKLKAEEEAAAKKLKAEEEAVKAKKEAAAKKLKAEKEAAAKKLKEEEEAAAAKLKAEAEGGETKQVIALENQMNGLLSMIGKEEDDKEGDGGGGGLDSQMSNLLAMFGGGGGDGGGGSTAIQQGEAETHPDADEASEPPEKNVQPAAYPDPYSVA
ncbi:hypothetical protein TeGR_g7328, partial [Tetraparma gracilis]